MAEVAEQTESATAKTPEPSIVTVSIENIDISDDVQPRTRLDPRTVEAYASSYEAGERLPLPVVFYDSPPQLGPKMWLADGFHRVRALRNIGRKKIQVDKRVGTKRDAVLFALEANIRHGLRMSNEDKRRCAEILLKDPDWSKWSDREISKKIGVSNTFVSNLRKELAGVNGSQVPEERKGSDGKVYRLPKRTETAPEAVGKWKCTECSTFWPKDVKVCKHCEPEKSDEQQSREQIEEIQRGEVSMVASPEPKAFDTPEEVISALESDNDEQANANEVIAKTCSCCGVLAQAPVALKRARSFVCVDCRDTAELEHLQEDIFGLIEMWVAEKNPRIAELARMLRGAYERAEYEQEKAAVQS